MKIEPGYQRLQQEGLLSLRADRLFQSLADCQLCPHRCRVDRLKGERGYCQTGKLARVASYAPHYGEETPLVGSGGSGTIFFAHCNLQCVYCQNYDLSVEGRGREVEPGKLAGIMLSLQDRGCSNINFVTPSHVIPQILKALELAAKEGLNLPLVYNSGGYDLAPVLQELEQVVDIYMPDIKYLDQERALRYSGIADYPQRVREALQTMHEQVGVLRLNDRGLARKGLMIRHLVLPGGLEDTRRILEFIAGELSPDTYLNLMDQYYPSHQAHQYQDLQSPLSRGEFRQAVRMAQGLGLNNLA